MDFFKKSPNIEIHTSEVTEGVKESFEIHGKKLQDISTDVNQLSGEGKLIKIKRKNGFYKYDPDFEQEGEFHDFSDVDKVTIFGRDGYKCVICGLGQEDGVEIAADHKIPRSKNGENSLENGQTLCNKHNSMKKNYSQTEAGKRYFIKIFEDALKVDDSQMIAFCKDIFNVYDKHGVDHHIKV
ncbi:HNH endonuclease [Candidatus Poribacteria bacterium]|nr:HNH endonuclease [Candidatus Poribacteria bacterium]